MLKKISRRSGFTLMEFLVVSGIIGLMLLIAKPHIVRSMIQTKEAACVTNLGKVAAAMNVYRILYRTYPSSLSDLTVVNPTISAHDLSSGVKRGYNFAIEQSTLTRHTFEVIAEPNEVGKDGVNKFKIDQANQMYKADAIGGMEWAPFEPIDSPIQQVNQ